MSSERFFFCHIPKAAGTSTMASLVDHFGGDAVYPLPEDSDNPKAPSDVEHLVSTFESRGDQIKVVAGHFPLCVTELLGVPFRTFTILREPVDRTLSHLRYQRKIFPEYAHMTLEEAYGVPFNLFGSIHNQMVKMLGMTLDEMNAGALSFVDCQDEHLERAKRALDDIDVVGVQSAFPAFLSDLERTFGWDLGEPVHANTTTPEPVDDAFLERIAADSPLDVALYQYAEDLVAGRAAEVNLRGR